MTNLPAVIPPQAQRTALPAILSPPPRGTAGRLTWKPAKQPADGSIAPPPRWQLRGDSSLLLLANRLFTWERADLKVGGKGVSFPDVPALFEDLLMVMHRYPVEIGASARAPFEARYADMLDEWRLRHGLEDEWANEAAPLFKGELRHYQVDGVKFMIAGRKVLLADDTGLGKTVEGLALLAKLQLWPAVIVAQTHMIPQWQREIAKFLDVGDNPGQLTSHTCERLKPPSDTPFADIYLIHYLLLRGWDDLFRQRKVQAVIFDEGQELRHKGTQKFDAAKTIIHGAEIAVPMSATPFYNRGPEIYNVLNLIQPGCLGHEGEFVSRWCTNDDMGKRIIEDPDRFGEYLRERKLMLRRTKAEVGRELPPKSRIVENVAGDNALFAELVKTAVKLAKEAATIRDPFDRKRMEEQAISETRRATGLAKAPAAVGFLRGLLEAEEPTLAFAHHHDVYDVLLNGLAEFEPVAMTGRETVAVKDRAKTKFIDGKTNLCLLSNRTATGLDGFQARSRIAVHCELDWSPQVHLQLDDRLWRDGQTEAVLCYYLVCELGTDPYMVVTNGIKESQFAGIMGEAPMTPEEMMRAAGEAEKHKQHVLTMLRDHR